MARHPCLALVIATGALSIGVMDHQRCAGLSWLESLLNAAMILPGMGLANELHQAAGKWFATFYALSSGVAFITGVGVLFAPIVHRFSHKFHLDAR